MEFAIGNIYFRVPVEPLKAGEVIVGHQHNFDHATFVQKGSFEISLLTVNSVDAAGNPLEATVEYTKTVSADDVAPFHLILKGRWHTLKALEDGSRYACIYAHQLPQAISVHMPGQKIKPPITKRDDDGTLWVRLNENIVQAPCGWIEAYR